MARVRFVVSLALTLVASSVRADPWPAIAIPPENAAALRRPPPRPPMGDFESARLPHVLQALSDGHTDAALDAFLPREPFLAIKDMSRAARYYDTLVRAYRSDLSAIRTELHLDGADPVQLMRFTPPTACTWMAIGHEANRLPYWSCYGTRLVVRAHGAEHTVRIHVLIHWGTQWYITHLGAIPHPAS